MLSPPIVRFWRHEPRNRELGYEIIYFALPRTLATGNTPVAQAPDTNPLTALGPRQFLQN